MSFGGPQSQALFRRPPSNGSFPIDHDKECTPIIDKYLLCLKENGNKQGPCRNLARDYLKCRMEKGLLEQKDLSDFGYFDDSLQSSPSPSLSESGKNNTSKQV